MNTAEYNFEGNLKGTLCIVHKMKGMARIFASESDYAVEMFHISDRDKNASDSEEEFDHHKSDDDFSPIKQPPAKKSRTRKEWVFVSSADSGEDAKILCMEKQHQDKTPMLIMQTKHLKDTFFSEFYCGARAKFGCTFQVKYVGNKNEGKPFSVYVVGSHTHSYDEVSHRDDGSAWGIAKHVQEFIKTCVADLKKPKRILREIREQGIAPKPSLKQIQNFCARVRETVQSEFPEENIGELVKWVRDHQYNPDIAEDEPFVLPGAVLPEHLAWEGNADVRVIFVLSTKKLLNNAVIQQASEMATICCSDATYNLLFNKWPVLAMGTLDWAHKFRTISLGVSSHQDQAAFEVLFASTTEGIQLVHGILYQPTYTLQDGAKEIYNASKQVLKPKEIGSCYFHCIQSVVKRKHKFQTMENFQEFLNNVQTLHASQSKEEYHNAAMLFISKWNDREPEHSAWFDDEYFTWRQTFFAALTPPGLPAANCSQEAFHGVLKPDCTQRDRMTCGRLCKALLQELKHQSSNDEMCAPFPSHPILVEDDWRKAQEWLVLNNSSIFVNKRQNAFCVPSSNYLATKPTMDVMRQDLRKWHQKVGPIAEEDFDAYSTRRGMFYEVKCIRPGQILSPFLVLCCSCVYYNKYAKCKHALAVAIGRNMISIPSRFSLQVIGTTDNKKRGQRALAPRQSNFRRGLQKTAKKSG
jgi:hypothetical protein